MAELKLFLTADIEGPHLSYYSPIDDPHFDGKWAYAENDGSPPEGALCWSLEHKDEAEKAAIELREHFSQHYFVDTISVMELVIE